MTCSTMHRWTKTFGTPPAGEDDEQGVVWQLKRALHGARRAALLFQNPSHDEDRVHRVQVAAQTFFHPSWQVLPTVHGDDCIAAGGTQVLDQQDASFFVPKEQHRIGPAELGGTRAREVHHANCQLERRRLSLAGRHHACRESRGRLLPRWTKDGAALDVGKCAKKRCRLTGLRRARRIPFHRARSAPPRSRQTGLAVYLVGSHAHAAGTARDAVDASGELPQRSAGVEVECQRPGNATKSATKWTVIGRSAHAEGDPQAEVSCFWADMCWTAPASSNTW